MKMALICSSGGHLYQMVALKGFWSQHSRFWVTFDRGDALFLLANETVYHAYSPTNRHVLNFIRNLTLAWRILAKEKPHVLISTGAGVGVPFIYVARVLGIRTIYIESVTRVDNLSLAGWMVYRVVDRFYVQWPNLEQRYKRVKYRGKVI